MFKLQEDSEIKIYNIVKCDYNISIQLTAYSIKISFLDQTIFITVPRVWDGHKRYIITNETTNKTTVLHKVVYTNQLAMYNHFIEAFQYIIHQFSSKHLLYVLKTILSLRSYPILARKFHYIWENPLFKTKYKLLKYTLRQNRIIDKLKKYESVSAFQEVQIKILELEFQKLSNDKRCIDI